MRNRDFSKGGDHLFGILLRQAQGKLCCAPRKENVLGGVVTEYWGIAAPSAAAEWLAKTDDVG